MYTVFSKENKNFSGIWSYFSEDHSESLKSYEVDSRKYSTSIRYAPREWNTSQLLQHLHGTLGGFYGIQY